VNGDAKTGAAEEPAMLAGFGAERPEAGLATKAVRRRVRGVDKLKASGKALVLAELSGWER